jgi:integrase
MDITFAQQAERFLAQLEGRRRKKIKPTTLATFRSAINIARPVLGNLPLETIDSEHLRQLVEVLEGQKYAPNSIVKVLQTAKKVIASATDERGNKLTAKFWNDEHINQPEARPLKQKDLLTAAQIEAALESAKICSAMRAFIAVEAATGLRVGEMRALNVEDFDFVAGMLHVGRTRSRFGETAPKTKSGERTVDLHPDITAMLTAMLEGRTTGRLFQLTDDQIRRAFERVELLSHDLRHFRYTWLQLAAVPNAIRDYWVGHSVPGMAKIYGHMAENVELRQKLAREIGYGFRLLDFAAPERQEAVAQATA